MLELTSDAFIFQPYACFGSIFKGGELAFNRNHCYRQKKKKAEVGYVCLVVSTSVEFIVMRTIYFKRSWS